MLPPYRAAPAPAACPAVASQGRPAHAPSHSRKPYALNLPLSS